MRGWSEFEGFVMQGNGLLKVCHDACAVMTI
jgi:hypothetical protein